jgi:hypothetical protein
VPFRFGQSLRPDNGQFQALFYGEDQMYYEIQASSNFVDWASMTNLTATAAPALILDPDAGSHRIRFYRAFCPPDKSVDQEKPLSVVQPRLCPEGTS